MQLAFGKMGMTPDVFWSMSFQEWFAAIEGFVDFHSSDSGTPPPLSRDELEDMRERFPD